MSVPCSDRIDEDSERGSRFSGYDRPRSTRGRIPKVREEGEVEFSLVVVMLLMEETRVIPTPLPIVTTPTTCLLILAKFRELADITGMIH